MVSYGRPARILVTGNMLRQPDLISRIEGTGAQVVGLDTCTGIRTYDKKVEEDGLIGAKGALADLDETVDQMLGTIYESRELEKSREVKL